MRFKLKTNKIIIHVNILLTFLISTPYVDVKCYPPSHNFLGATTLIHLPRNMIMIWFHLHWFFGCVTITLIDDGLMQYDKSYCFRIYYPDQS